MHRQVALTLRRSCRALFLASLAVTAAAAQGEPGAPTKGGLRKTLWRSTSDTTRTMTFIPTQTGSVAIQVRGQYEGVVFPRDDGTGFIGIARSPEGQPAQPGATRRYEVLHVVRVDSMTVSVSFSASVSDPGGRSEVWRLDRSGPAEPAPKGQQATPPVAVLPDTASPKFGDYVYVEELPEAIHRVPPEYPASASAKGLVGTVMVQVLLGKDGLVKDVRVVRSIPELDALAIEAVKKWRFKPALAKGKPVEVWVGVPIKFPPN